MSHGRDPEFNTPLPDSEFNTPLKETEYNLPSSDGFSSANLREEGSPCHEFENPGLEVYGAGPQDESEDSNGQNKKKSSASSAHRILKSAVKYVAGVAVAVVLVVSALGVDLLGKDVFGSEGEHMFWEILFSSFEDSHKKDTGGNSGSVIFFPNLPNKDPDFDGKYAWGTKTPDTSEEFLRFIGEDAEYYAVAGGYYKNLGITESVSEGASYDRASNTLTLDGFNGENLTLEANLMGNGFKILLKGSNTLGSIAVWGAEYGGSVTFTGDGTLTVNSALSSENGIVLYAEDSRSCIMVDKNVTLTFYGENGAVKVYDSTDAKCIYYLYPQTMAGGVITSWNEDENTFITVLDSSGPSSVVYFGH